MTAEASLARNMRWFTQKLLLEQNNDIVKRPFHALGLECMLLYMEGMCSGQLIAQHVLRPLLRCREKVSGAEALTLSQMNLLEASEVKTETNMDAAAEELLRGQCLVLLDSVKEIIIVDARSYVHRPVMIPQTENVVIGPHEAFNESLRDNLTLLHRKLQSENFIVKIMAVGQKASIQLALCYLDGICPADTVQQLTQRLEGAAVDCVQSGGMLEQLIEDDPYAPLPQVLGTERPDRAVSFLLEGQAVVLLDGSPRALTMPVSIWHLFHAPDDSAMRWQYGTFMRLLRLLGATLALLLPAVFVSVVIFQPMVLPATLLTSILESRATVPISLFGEALLMLTVFNLINEAGTRIPGLMGSSLGLVSALILGSAAVDAALVSPLLIIVVALSGLGSYALPDYSLSMAFRLLQLALLVAGGLMGFPGVVLVLVYTVIRVAGMRSLGHPFLAPCAPARQHNPDLVMRAPIFRQRLRAYLANPAQTDRAEGRMRRFSPRRKEGPRK